MHGPVRVTATSTMADSTGFGRLRGRSGALCLAALLLGGCGDAGEPQMQGVDTEAVTTTPKQSGIEHVVVVMMENRSFDHLLGWLPGADGRQAGLTYLDRAGAAHATHPLAPDYQGCDHPDPDHSYAGGRVEYDNGASDGWLRAGENDDYAIGYYGSGDLRFLGQA
ncbi:MAG TPA: alkaline phosphatase family protein, partial [Polyangiaceae bacterium]|nr:alkaline phosphatase family protein [Polyangiaceae bacterium]